MIKEIKNYINLSIITSILFALLGIIIFLFPKTMLNIFSYIVALIAIMLGIYLIILEIKTKNNIFVIGSSLFGSLLLVLGLIIITHPNSFAIIIPLGLGIWFITSSVVKFRFSLVLQKELKGLWLSTLIMTILSIMCGIIFIINPIKSSVIITSSFGLIIIIYAIIQICQMIIFKTNIKKISKIIKEKMKIIN